MRIAILTDIHGNREALSACLAHARLLEVDRLLSERIRLDDINPALDRLARGESIRQVILMH